jgi:phosphoglycolate phosphatase-like HAD superfamily hydrolase
VGQVTREACADAFGQVTGRRPVQLPPTAGRTDSEVFFEALALNAPEFVDEDPRRLLAAYSDALARAFEARRDVEAARVGGARSIAVVSGRATHAELAAAGADAVLADLADTEALVRTIDELTLPAVRSDTEG